MFEVSVEKMTVVVCNVAQSNKSDSGDHEKNISWNLISKTITRKERGFI